MKLLFTHGTRLKEDRNGDLYTGGSYNNEVWERYTSVFEKVTVLAKKEPHIYKVDEAIKRFNNFDNEKIDFIEVYDSVESISSFVSFSKRKSNNDIIESTVKNSDYLIARVPSGISNKAIEFAKKYKKPYLIEVVGCPWDALWNHSLKGKIIAPFSYMTMKKIVRQSEYTVYVTNEFLQGRYPTKGKSISASNVMLSSFDDEILVKRLNKVKKYNKNSKLIIGTVAAVDVKYKGQQYIIEALGQLKKEGNINFEYHIVGDGDQTFLKKTAEKYNVEKQVKFLGGITHSEVFAWLDTIDLYTQPSRQEGLPRALIEAMSRGLPAIGAKTAGIPELLESKYIFSNTKKNIIEISNLIKSIDKDSLEYQAKRNYRESKKYNKKIIENRRRNFFEKFKHEYI